MAASGFLKHSARNRENSRLQFLSASFYEPEPFVITKHGEKTVGETKNVKEKTKNILSLTNTMICCLSPIYIVSHQYMLSLTNICCLSPICVVSHQYMLSLTNICLPRLSISNSHLILPQLKFVSTKSATL